jgi:hypothetical protein
MTKRPRDTVSNAIHIAKIATGEIEETVEDDGKDPNAKALGAKGGRARAEKMSAKRRSEIAKKAANARWKSS